jgi:tetratricopeptide repeat protein 21B
VCSQLGKVYEELNDNENACKWYQKAAKHDTTNSKASLSLATVLAKRNDYAAAQAQLSLVMQNDTESTEKASMIMAQILCQQSSFSSAAFHYRQIVEKSPSNYIALEQYIEVSRRVDKMDDVESLFKLIENKLPRAKMDLGHIFCQGIFLR